MAVVSAPIIARVGEEIVLDGSSSYSEADVPLDYRWSVLEEPGLGMLWIESSTDAVTTAVASMEGVYRLNLTVSDGIMSDVVGYKLYIEAGDVPAQEAEGNDAGECLYENEYIEHVEPYEFSQ